MSGDLFPLPPKYIFQNELPSGFLGHSALIQAADSTTLYLCKSVEKERIGTPDKIQRFKERLDHIQAVRNPFVLGYSEIIEAPDRILLIRPFIPEAPITESLGGDNVKIDPQTIFGFWKNVCQCFKNMHAHHIFPNFIKPNNIFIIKESAIVITDLYPPPSDMDIMLHSPNPFDVGFLAPEFFNQMHTGVHSDLWSLGVLLAFMITRALPWPSKNLFTVLQQINSGNLQFATPVPQNIEEVIRSLVKLDPTKRILPNQKMVIVTEPTNAISTNLPPNSVGGQMHRIASGRMSNVGFMVLQDTSKSPMNSVRATTTKLLQNGLKKGNNGAAGAAGANFLLRSRQMPSSNLNSPHTSLNGSAMKLPSFRNVE